MFLGHVSDHRGTSVQAVARSLTASSEYRRKQVNASFLRLLDRAPTALATLRRAHAIALAEGLHHVYTGNLPDPEGGTTHCVGCGAELIARSGYRILVNRSGTGICFSCGQRISGLFYDN